MDPAPGSSGRQRRSVTVHGSREDCNAVAVEGRAANVAAIRAAEEAGEKAEGVRCEDVEAIAKRRELDFIYIGPPKGRVAAVLYPPRRYYGRAPRPERRPARARGSRRQSRSRGSPSSSDPDEPPSHLALGLELVRDDRDRSDWRPVATVAHRGRLEVVATAWLEEADPPPGSYRLERGRARLEVHYTGREDAR